MWMARLRARERNFRHRRRTISERNGTHDRANGLIAVVHHTELKPTIRDTPAHRCNANQDGMVEGAAKDLAIGRPILLRCTLP